MLDDLKMLLGIASDDNDRNSLLLLLVSSVTARLKNLLGGIDPPESLDYIVREVTVIRFNKIGSEGMSSHSVDGESLQFTDNDFEGFMDDIQAFLDTQKDSVRGKVRFL